MNGSGCYVCKKRYVDNYLNYYPCLRLWSSKVLVLIDIISMIKVFGLTTGDHL